MNVNKKLDRLKQWAGERMGAEVKTSLSDDFRALEEETNLRYEGMEKIHRTMANYNKSINKCVEDEHKDKQLPIAQLGAAMAQHGDEYEGDSQFGRCLTVFGLTQENLARSQQLYAVGGAKSWLESLERSLAQMKEYQSARRKLDSRRLAYDTSLAKMQKAKREDFRVEEELRSQKLKFEEAEEDVYRRMLDIKDAEGESTADLTAFLDAQLAYHERCRDALLQLRRGWPASSALSSQPKSNPANRSRSNTARSWMSNQSSVDERGALEVRAGIRPTHTPIPYLESPIEREIRPSFNRSTTFDATSRPRRDISPVQSRPMVRVPSDSVMLSNARSGLRNAPQIDTGSSADGRSFSAHGGDQASEQSCSSALSHSSSALTPLTMKKRGPPPPPPSRATKPAPPPPPPARRVVMA